MDEDIKKVIIITCVVLFIIIMELTVINSKFSKENFEPIGTDITTKEDNLKKDNLFDYVYDAAFSFNITSTSYTTNNGEEYTINDIKLPHINIDSKDADRINNEIEVLFNSSLKTFEKGLSDSESFVTDTYTYSINDKILSILITDKQGQNDIENATYYVYNISLKDGKQLTNEDLYNYLEYDNVNDKLQSNIEKYIKNELKDYKYTDSKDINYYIEESMKDIKNVKCYIDSDKTLEAVVKITMPTVSENFYTILPID